ncbi:MAG: hypothetical protein ACLFTB_09485 [Desulfovibrionales bacterium]
MSNNSLRTCVSPRGSFVFGVHRPQYSVDNLREHDDLTVLGTLPDGSDMTNHANFPEGDVTVDTGSTIYEIPNAFPFRGTTFIDSSWAEARAQDPGSIRLHAPAGISLAKTLQGWADEQGISPEVVDDLIGRLPAPVKLALATTSADREELIRLAEASCEFITQKDGSLLGLRYVDDGHGARPVIHDHDLFEAVANNPYLPLQYRQVMVLRPGAQGGSEIVGEYTSGSGRTHIYEYLRGNSYIPWGHYAANFAHDAPRYQVLELDLEDMTGLRHLYYQRTFMRLAREIGVSAKDGALSVEGLEQLRRTVLDRLANEPFSREKLTFTSTLWGWNFGFDFAPSRYRLHASHQQIHQQYALVPEKVEGLESGIPGARGDLPAFGCGDLVAAFLREYRLKTGQGFFDDYLRALESNTRTDGREGESGLVVHEDANCLVFVPKAQTSQWELQLMTKQPVGNILEADQDCRKSLDRAMLIAVHVLGRLGARMITSIEFPKRFTDMSKDQHLLYSFLPRLPWSPGAFSEAQLRFVNGHYPEDFAAACRSVL